MIRYLRTFFHRWGNGFLPPDHPALENEENKRRINVLMSLAMGAGPTLALWAGFLYPAHPRHALIYAGFLFLLALGTVFVIRSRGRYVIEVIIVLLFAAWVSALARSALSTGNPAAETPYVAALVLAVHLLLGRWLSLGSLFFMVASFVVLDVIRGELGPKEIASRDWQFRFYIHTTVAGILVWILSEAYSKLRDSTEKALRSMRQEMARDLELARNIQIDLLPPPRSSGRYAFHAVMKTAARVGGDYYDHVETGRNNWFAIGDATGHGLQAGMLALQVRSLFRHILPTRPDLPPSAILTAVNNAFAAGIRPLRSRAFMTFLLLKMDEKGRVVHAGGHLKILHWQKNTAKLHVRHTSGPWLGLEYAESSVVQDHEFTMDPGDLVVLYTDGCTDAADLHGRRYGEEALHQSVARTAESLGDKPLEVFNEAVVAGISSFTGKKELDDDLSLLTIRRESWSLES